MPRSASVFVWRGEGVRFWPVQDCDRCAVGPAAICRRRLAISGQSLLLLSISPRAYKCKGYLDERSAKTAKTSGSSGSGHRQSAHTCP